MARKSAASKAAALLSSMRKTHGAGTGRPRIMKICERCGREMCATEFRGHKPKCPAKKEN